MATLSPTEKHFRKLHRKILATERACIKTPGKGKGAAVTRSYGCMTASELFAHAIVAGKRIRKLDQREQRFLTIAKTIHLTNDHIRADHIESPAMLHSLARGISNRVYDLPSTWTGMSSQTLFESGQTPVEEHFYPRQWSGYLIINYIIKNKGIEFTLLVDLLRVFSQVHYVMPDENSRLEYYQRPDRFNDWREGYDEICGPLIRVKDKDPILEIGNFLLDYHKYLVDNRTKQWYDCQVW